MDSRFGAVALLCGLVLVGYVVETSCHPLPDRIRKDLDTLINKLNGPLNGVEEIRTGGFFKNQIVKMRQHFNKTEQRLVVVEMLDLYSRIFQNFTAGHSGQQGSATTQHPDSVGEAAESLQNHLKELLNGYPDLHNSNQLLRNIHTIRDHKVEGRKQQLEALNDFRQIYKQAYDLSK